MASIQEKDLVFDFPDNWVFTKYDASFHHTQLLNKVQGFQAVDIVAMPLGQGPLLLLEVKDFRKGLNIGGRSANYSEYIASVANKVLNTVSGLFTAHRVGDEPLRGFYGRLLKRNTPIQAVFFLEELPLPPSPTYNAQYAYLNARTQLIGMLSNLGFEVEVYSLTNLPTTELWTVIDRYVPPTTPPPAIPSRPKKKK